MRIPNQSAIDINDHVSDTTVLSGGSATLYPSCHRQTANPIRRPIFSGLEPHAPSAPWTLSDWEYFMATGCYPSENYYPGVGCIHTGNSQVPSQWLQAGYGNDSVSRGKKVRPFIFIGTCPPSGVCGGVGIQF